MTQSDLGEFGRMSGRSRAEVVIDDHPTLPPTSRFRASDEDEIMNGGLRHAADIWRRVTAKRRQSRKA
jgi:hypothetical protein